MSEEVVIAQITPAITTIFYDAAFATGYFLLIRATSRSSPRCANGASRGRPQVSVEARSLTCPAWTHRPQRQRRRNITFEFSEPLASPDGFVLSGLAYLRRGMDFLSPGKEVACV